LPRTFAYWCDEVYYAHALLAAIAEVKSFMRIDRHHIGKMWAFAEVFRSHATHRLDGDQSGFAFLSLETTGNGCSFSQGKAANMIWANHHFGQSRSIRPVSSSYHKLLFADTFQYSSSRFGHRNFPWTYLQKQIVIKETSLL
jgi:hypothetical protein